MIFKIADRKMATMINKYIKTCTVLFLLNWCVAAFCEPPEIQSVDIVSGSGAYILSLDEVTLLALQNNFDIQLAKYDALIARTEKGVSESIYDTIIDMEVKYRRDESKQVSTIWGNKSLDNDYNLSVSKKLPSGTTLTLDSINNRNWTDSVFATLNPSHDTSLGITVAQELGKNFFGLQDRGDIKITKLDIQNSKYTSLDKIEADLADTQKAYWDLVLQAERVQIENEMVAQAKQLFDLNKNKLDDGLAEMPDVLAAEANYKERINQFILAQNTLKTKENTLRLLLNIVDDEISLKPSEQFFILSTSEQRDTSLKYAFENRYDYKEAKNIIKSKNIKMSLKKNDLWPEINLSASLARNGVDVHFNQAFRQIGEEDNPDFTAVLTISFPLENTEARSKLKAAELEKAQALLSLKQLERKIVVGIIDKVRNCNVLKELAGNSVAIAGLQGQKLKAEEKRFSQGRSDTDTLIRFQDDVTRSKWIAAQAKYSYYTALIDLRVQEGRLLNQYWDAADL